ncbi:hypothetical protein [Streptomyces sp. SCL15-4]|uniref:hypothetical protein n=1 Tax=Streptomyces sp. SCL15-4 TaxID=2967221 RepID=UPI0029676CDA|nr:hypothetical protein [Streptomyces sp. SCL15-4]
MTQQPVSTPWQVPWPDGVTHRYANLVGATVDITDSGRGRYDTKCTGCPYGNSSKFEANAHTEAQAHAERCRALPRPEATR